MNLLKALLFIALSLQPWYKDAKTEDPADRAARYAVISHAVNYAVDETTCTGSQKHNPYCKRVWRGTREQLAFLLLTQAYFESRFARNVHAGKCEPYQCDAYKDKDGKVRHRSTSIWQIQASNMVPLSEWKRLAGLDQASTNRAALTAAKIISVGYSRCRTIPGAISIYAGIPRCDWPGAKYRTAFYERMLRKARQAHKKNYKMKPKKGQPEFNIESILREGDTPQTVPSERSEPERMVSVDRTYSTPRKSSRSSQKPRRQHTRGSLARENPALPLSEGPERVSSRDTQDLQQREHQNPHQSSTH
jgi:hypothetical protein